MLMVWVGVECSNGEYYSAVESSKSYVDCTEIVVW